MKTTSQVVTEKFIDTWRMKTATIGIIVGTFFPLADPFYPSS